MTSYYYKARDRYGVLTDGTMEAEDSRAVAVQLEKNGFMPISISQVESGILAKFEKWRATFQKVDPEDLIVFTRQLASVLEAGVPLIEGLDAVHEQVRNGNFKNVILAVRTDVESGVSFSDALEKHKAVFSPMMTNMVRVGESAGILDEVLDRISNLLEKDYETGNKIKTASRYPMIVGITLIGAFIIMTTFVIPRYASFFGSFKADLPLPTRILMGINYVVSHFWWMILSVAIAAIYLFNRFLSTERGRYSWDRFVLSTPIFGALFAKIYLSRFNRMLAAMMGSGIPILEALTISSATAENKVISKVIIDIREQVAKGKNLTEPMKGSKVFPPIAISMAAIGEKAGTLEKMLNKVADYFDREADYTIKNLTPLLEPILIGILAVFLLIFALGIFMPMWDLVKVYKNF
ncbi:MAG: type II secretion system F family protein [Candidatus Margulisbacteria bacterium]|nr:type II secretion system F family protein [Candidatus Margulisiibacteriota bacterium]